MNHNTVIDPTNSDAATKPVSVAANGFLRHVDYPDGGLKLPVPPILFDEEAGDPPPAPDFGADTAEVLRSIGVDDTELERLRASGVVA